MAGQRCCWRQPPPLPGALTSQRQPPGLAEIALVMRRYISVVNSAVAQCMGAGALPLSALGATSFWELNPKMAWWIWLYVGLGAVPWKNCAPPHTHLLSGPTLSKHLYRTCMRCHVSLCKIAVSCEAGYFKVKRDLRCVRFLFTLQNARCPCEWPFRRRNAALTSRSSCI